MRTTLTLVWSDWRIRLALVIGLAAAAGLTSAWLTPRGPATISQAVLSMALALAVGAATGLLMGSRWSMLVAPAVFVIVLEFARLGVAGPTVDGVHLGTMYGLIAFVVGRLFHAVLVLPPMILGARYGLSLAARLGMETASPMGTAGRIVTGAFTVAVLALGVSVALPANIRPITGPDGRPLPGSVAELIEVPIGGHNQAMMIRGRSTENPVLLYLAGGPGGTDLGAMRRDVTLEQYFVVATWEQRGVGKSYSALDPTSTLTVEQMVADTVQVITYLQDRFDEQKIYLVGNSWGALLGTLVVEQHPELIHAYVGTGQMVSARETDIMFYEDTLSWADRTGNDKLAATLRQNGPPPYENLLHYEAAVSHEHSWNPYTELNTDNEMPANLFVPENSLIDRINGFRSFLDTFYVLYPQLQGIDFRRDVPRLDVPVHIVTGKHEARGRAVLAYEWFEMLEAPSKEMHVFEGSGHRPQFDEPGAFAEVMKSVRDDTYVSAAASTSGSVASHK